MSKNKFQIILITIIIIAIGGYLYNSYNKSSRSASSPKPKTEQKTELKKLKLAHVNDIEDLGFLIDFAKDKKFFSKANLDIESITVENKLTDILVSGEADASIGGSVGPLSGYLNNIELRLLATPFNGFSFFIVSRFPKNKAISIKKVAIQSFGKDNHMMMITALKNLGLDPSKVEFVSAPFSSQKTLLDKKEIDAMIAPSEKFIIESGLDQKYYIFEPSEAFGKSNLPRTIITTQKTLNQKPQELKSLVTATYEALEYASSNQKETINYIKEKYKYSDGRATKFYDRFIQARKGINFIPDINSLKDALDFAKRETKPSNPDKDLKDFIYPNFAGEAVKKNVK